MFNGNLDIHKVCQLNLFGTKKNQKNIKRLILTIKMNEFTFTQKCTDKKTRKKNEDVDNNWNGMPTLLKNVCIKKTCSETSNTKLQKIKSRYLNNDLFSICLLHTTLFISDITRQYTEKRTQT